MLCWLVAPTMQIYSDNPKAVSKSRLDELSSSSMSEDAHSGIKESSLSWQPAQAFDIGRGLHEKTEQNNP